MCHGQAVKAFPTPAPGIPFHSPLSGFAWGQDSSDHRVAILPDIYGCSPFYLGLSTLLAERGARVFLIDTFHGLGELPEATREAAFARRHKVRDKAFIDQFESFVEQQSVSAVIGFCLGGLYVFELSRRGMNVDLIGLYGFPQGLPNQDELPVPFDYMTSLKTPFTMLMGREDASVGADNINRLEDIASDVPAMKLKVYEGVGHNFLPLLDSDKPEERSVAEDALKTILETLS